MRHFILVIALLFSASTQAGIYSNALGRCLVESTSHADKTNLVRWIFAISSLHPEVAPISNITDEQRKRMQQQTADMFQRLMTQSCRDETKQAVRYEGAQMAIQTSFGLLGQIAMKEMMGHGEVNAGFERFAQHVDAEKLRELGLDQ